jgi:hypothetical protein
MKIAPAAGRSETGKLAVAGTTDGRERTAENSAGIDADHQRSG